jgi:hypothetical protein
MFKMIASHCCSLPVRPLTLRGVCPAAKTQ